MIWPANMGITEYCKYISNTFGEKINTKTAVLITGAAGLIGYSIWRWGSRPKGMPPGPIRVPIIGSWLLLISNHEERFHCMRQLADKHGGIFSVYVGNRWVGYLIKTITCMKRVKLCFHLCIWSASTFFQLSLKLCFHLYTYSTYTILITSGQVWKYEVFPFIHMCMHHPLLQGAI